MERIRILFCEQSITIFSIVTALSMIISTIALAVAGVFGEEGGARDAPPKDERVLKKMVRQAGRCTQKTCRKFCRSIACYVGAILIFLGKSVGFCC